MLQVRPWDRCAIGAAPAPASGPVRRGGRRIISEHAFAFNPLTPNSIVRTREYASDGMLDRAARLPYSVDKGGEKWGEMALIVDNRPSARIHNRFKR